MHTSLKSHVQSPFLTLPIILSMVLVSIGNGLMYSYIPIRLSAGGYDPAWAGAILSITSLGSIMGCVLTNRIVRRVGHARAYIAFTALIILSNIAAALLVDPKLWLFTRFGYGFAVAALFILAQSWLNDLIENRVRGRVMAVFYIGYIMGMGVGSLLMRWLSIEGNTAPLVAILLGTLSILPIGLTTLPNPQAPAVSTISFKRAWAISPVGLMAMLAVGGMSMLVGGYTPIHLSASGYTKDEIALLMFAMPIGTLLFQLPAGWISDRIDRRFVLAACALISATAASICGLFDGTSLILLAAFFIIWDGTTESIYSIGNAYAGDKAKKEELVELSSTMLFAWSVSGFIVPAIATALATRFGTVAYFPLAITLALAFSVFVVWRIVQTGVQTKHKASTAALNSAGTPLGIDAS